MDQMVIGWRRGGGGVVDNIAKRAARAEKAARGGDVRPRRVAAHNSSKRMRRAASGDACSRHGSWVGWGAHRI